MCLVGRDANGYMIIWRSQPVKLRVWKLSKVSIHKWVHIITQCKFSLINRSIPTFFWVPQLRVPRPKREPAFTWERPNPTHRLGNWPVCPYLISCLLCLIVLSTKIQKMHVFYCCFYCANVGYGCPDYCSISLKNDVTYVYGYLSSNLL